jgi:hypothetical protein
MSIQVWSHVGLDEISVFVIVEILFVMFVFTVVVLVWN